MICQVITGIRSICRRILPKSAEIPYDESITGSVGALPRGPVRMWLAWVAVCVLSLMAFLPVASYCEMSVLEIQKEQNASPIEVEWRVDYSKSTATLLVADILIINNSGAWYQLNDGCMSDSCVYLFSPHSYRVFSSINFVNGTEFNISATSDPLDSLSLWAMFTADILTRLLFGNELVPPENIAHAWVQALEVSVVDLTTEGSLTLDRYLNTHGETAIRVAKLAMDVKNKEGALTIVKDCVSIVLNDQEFLRVLSRMGIDVGSAAIKDAISDISDVVNFYKHKDLVSALFQGIVDTPENTSRRIWAERRTINTLPVAEDKGPVGSVIRPPAGATIGDLVDLSAYVLDSNSPVYRVTFLVSTTGGDPWIPVGVDYKSPYQATADLSGFPDGTIWLGLEMENEKGKVNRNPWEPISVEKDSSPLPPNEDSASFVEDITIPDYSDWFPGLSITKTWRIKNSGSTTWNSGYELRFLSGAQMGGPSFVFLDVVQPGETYDISVDLITPAIPGRYLGWWALHNDAGDRLGEIFCAIDVVPEDLLPEHSCMYQQHSPAGEVEMQPGEMRVFQVGYKNIGTRRWVNGPDGVTNQNYIELRSCDAAGTVIDNYLLYDSSSWTNRQRVTTLRNSSVDPGEVAWFEFSGVVPSDTAAGAYQVYFRPYHATGGYIEDWGNVCFTIRVPDGSPKPVSSDDIYPRVHVDFPNGGEELHAGSLVQVRWTASDNVGVTSVDLHVSSDGGATYVLDSTVPNTGQAFVSLAGIPCRGRIKVVANDAAGNSTADESDASFDIVSSRVPPRVPFLHNPGLRSPTGRYPILWTVSPRAQRYILEEDNNPSFSDPEIYTMTGYERWFSGKTNGTYYYRVRAEGKYGDLSDWSEAESIEVRVNQAPYVPANPSPTNGQTDVPRTGITLTWSGGDSDGTAEYAIGFTTNPDLSGQENTLTNYMPGTSYPLDTGLLPGTTYYWWVVAKDNDGMVTEGPKWRFTTESTLPDLLPTDLSITGEPTRVTTVTATMTIRNAGTYRSTSATAYFYYSTLENQRQQRLGSAIGIAPLEPGEEQLVQQDVVFSHLQSGTTYLVGYVTLDSSGPEMNIDNNVSSLPISVTDENAPDIWWVRFHPNIETVKSGLQYQIRSYVEDDLDLARADLAYSTDAGITWMPLASGLEIGGEWDLIMHDWAVPATFPVGPDILQFRVTAWDADDNFSTLVSQLYDVIDGTAPIVRVISPNGGEQLVVGSEVEILWEVISPNGIDQGYILVESLGDHILFFDSATNTGHFTWTVPGEPTNVALIRIGVVDLNGNYTVDRSDGYFSIVDPDQPTAPWGQPQVFTTSGRSLPRMCADSTGRLHVACFSEDLPEPDIAYYRFEGGSWSFIGTIYTNASEYDLLDLNISVGSDNYPHVTWKERRGATHPEQDDDVMYSSYDGSAWSLPFQVSHRLNNSLESFTGDSTLCLDSDGRVHVVWKEVDTAAAQVSRRRTFHRIHESGDWNAPSVATDPASFDKYHHIVSDGTGGIRMICIGGDPGTDYSTIYEASWNSGGWSPLSPIHTALSMNTLYWLPRLQKGIGTKWHATWLLNQPNDDAGILYSEKGDGWSIPEYLAYGTGVAQRGAGADLAINSEGTLQAVWMDFVTGIGFEYTILHHSQRTATGWSPVGALSCRPDGAVALSDWPMTTVAVGDTLHVVWSGEYEGTGQEELKHNVADVSEDLTPPSVIVSQPAEALVVPCGVPTTIEWQATDNIGVFDVSIRGSTDSWTTSFAIATQISNSGSFEWSVPAIEAATAQVTVTARDAFGNGGIGYSGAFSISDTLPPLVEVIAPNGGEVWEAGTQQTIVWTATDNIAVARVELFYSIDGGTQWITSATEETNDGSYDWTVPMNCSQTCLIRVKVWDQAENVGEDPSDAVFAIREPNHPPVEPHSPSPSDGGTLIVSQAQLGWNCYDSDPGDTLVYDVYLGNTGDLGLGDRIASGLADTHIDTAGLVAGATYYWQIVASDGLTSTTGPVWICRAINPVGAPVDVVAQAASGGAGKKAGAQETTAYSVSVDWADESDNEDGFRVERKNGLEGTFVEVGTVASDATSFTDETVDPNGEYLYRVVAFNLDADSNRSNEAVAATGNLPPATPSNPFPQDASSEVSISTHLGWEGGDPDSGDTVLYELLVREGSGPLTSFGLISSATYQPSLPLSPNQPYEWRVIAEDTSGQTAEGPEWAFTTGVGFSPIAPANLEIFAASEESAIIVWADMSDNEDGFRVERRISGGFDYLEIASTEYSYVIDESVSMGNTYFYRIRAFNSWGYSDYTDEVEAQIPGTDVTSWEIY